MNTKERLIERISGIEDESILGDLMQMLELELNLSESVIILSDEQKAFIDEGINDLKTGNVVDDATAKKMTREWLEKR